MGNSAFESRIFLLTSKLRAINHSYKSIQMNQSIKVIAISIFQKNQIDLEKDLRHLH